MQASADYMRLAVRLTPNGGRNAFDGVETDANGNSWLKVRVTAAPEEGRANAALITLLAKALHLPKSAIAIASGQTTRKKILRINGDPEDLMKRLGAL